MFGCFLRITSIILLTLLVIACGGGSDSAGGDTNVTPSNLTVFLAPEGRQYANKRWRRFSTDVMLPSAKQWEVEVTGDIELFSKLPSYSGTARSFVGHFRMEIAPDFEDPQDANLDNVYEVDLTAYVPNTQPRQIVANAKINLIISNENNSTWQDNGLRFITSPIQRLDYLNLGNELLQTSARHRFSMLTPTRLIDDIDGGGAADLMLSISGGGFLQGGSDGVSELRPIAQIIRGEWIETADGAVSDLAIPPQGEVLTFLAPPSGLSELQSINELPDMDGDNLAEFLITAQYSVPSPDNQDIGTINIFGFYIVSGQQVREAFVTKNSHLILGPKSGLEPGKITFVQVDNGWGPIEYSAATNGGEPRVDIISDVNNGGIAEVAFTVVSSHYAFTNILKGELLKKVLSEGGKHTLSSLAVQGSTINFNQSDNHLLNLEYSSGKTERPTPVGDLNGDGLIDFAIAIESDHDNDFLTDPISSLFLVSGTSYQSLDGSIFTLAELINTDKARALAHLPFRRKFGKTFTGIEDVDGDGYDDIYVSSDQKTYNFVNGDYINETFPSYVLYGSSEIFSSPPAFSISDFESRGDLIEVEGTMVEGDRDSCGHIPRKVALTQADLDGDQRNEVILSRRIECGEVDTQVFILGSKRLAARQSIDIENPSDRLTKFGLGADFEFMVGLKPLRAGQAPLGLSMGNSMYGEYSVLLTDLTRVKTAAGSTQRLPNYPGIQDLLPQAR